MAFIALHLPQCFAQVYDKPFSLYVLVNSLLNKHSMKMIYWRASPD